MGVFRALESCSKTKQSSASCSNGLRRGGNALAPSSMSVDGGNPEALAGNAAKKAESKAGEELAKLKFEMKNQSMAKLPPNLTVERRPLIHAPVASPFAGAGVQKMVYVSRNTPIMSAVKRVKKLLLHMEKRVMQGVDLTKDRNGMKKLAEANEKLRKNGEQVLVKASGRAMEQALRVGEWFRNREDELACHVEVRTGSVQAVDDIVEKEADHSHSEGPEDISGVGIHDTSLISTSEGQEVDSTWPAFQSTRPDNSAGRDEVPFNQDSNTNATKSGETQQKRRRRGKRKKELLDEDTIARIRWVKTVEVAISLKC